MPRVPDDVQDCVFYLYRSEEDARLGENAGGTGFFFSVEVGTGPGTYYYAVTNWHNIFAGEGAPVIRINTKHGEPDIFPLDHLDWVYKPKWHDLAIADIQLDMSRHKVAFVSSKWLALSGELEDFGIGLGSDIFMVGRFMDHDGGAVNVPAVRFGNISVMPQPIRQPTGATDLPSYILDLHSRTGFSGSPVFVFHDQTKLKGGILTSNIGHAWVRLLGIHWGQFPERWDIEADGQSNIRRKEALDMAKTEPPHANYVKGFSGMTLAIPVDAIMELLEMSKLKEPRERAFAEAQRAHRKAPVPESSEPPAK